MLFVATLATAGITGCTSYGNPRASTAPFLKRPPPPGGLHDIALTAGMYGRIVDRDGCFVLESRPGAGTTVVFAPGFTLNRETGEISSSPAGGETVKLGEKRAFGGGETDRRELDAEGTPIPESCPENMLRIDMISSP